VQSLINAGKNFLAAWPGYLALGALGAIMALLREAVHRCWSRRLAQWASACALFLASEGVVIGWTVQQRTQHASYLASKSLIFQRLYAPFYLLSNLELSRKIPKCTFTRGKSLGTSSVLTIYPQSVSWWYHECKPQ